MPPKKAGTPRKKRSDAGKPRKTPPPAPKKKKSITKRFRGALESIKERQDDIVTGLKVAGAVAGSIAAIGGAAAAFKSKAKIARQEHIGLNDAERLQEQQAEEFRQRREGKQRKGIFEGWKGAKVRKQHESHLKQKERHWDEVREAGRISSVKQAAKDVSERARVRREAQTDSIMSRPAYDPVAEAQAFADQQKKSAGLMGPPPKPTKMEGVSKPPKSRKRGLPTGLPKRPPAVKKRMTKQQRGTKRPGPGGQGVGGEKIQKI